MFKAWVSFVGACTMVLMAGIAGAQDISLGLGDQSGAAGATVDFNFSYMGPANAQTVTFDIVYDAAAQARFTAKTTTTATKMDCAVGPNIADGVVVSGSVQTSKNNLHLVFTGLSTLGITPFGITEGVLGSCKFIVNGSGAIQCNPTKPPTAAGVMEDGTTVFEIGITCHDGTLTVGGGGEPTATATTGGELPTATATTAPATATATTVPATATKTTAAATATATTAPSTPTRTATSAPSATKTPVPVTLKSGISATDTTIVLLGDTTALPASNGTIKIDNETITYASKSFNSGTGETTLSGVVRGSGATSHSAGAAVAVVTGGGATFEDEDGCQIGMSGTHSSAWLLLIPALGLLVMRRRH